MKWESVYTNVNVGTGPRIPPGGSLEVVSGPLRLHIENLEYRAKGWSSRSHKRVQTYDSGHISFGIYYLLTKNS